MIWRAYPDPHSAAAAAAAHILSLAPGSLAISGGSTPKLLFADLARSAYDWSRLQLFWADERCVPPDDPESNYGLAEEHLIEPAGIPRPNVHRICGEFAPEVAAAQYSAELVGFFGGNPHFDVVHLGMGPDAHTASLFPGDALIDDRDNLTAPVFASKKPNWRVTLLPRALIGARHVVFLVTGADKAPALRSVIEGAYNPRQFPAQRIAREAREVIWFLDQAAAAELKPAP